MLTPSQLEWIRKGLERLIICLFFGLLWLPTLDSFFHLDKSSIPNENRAPTEFPVFNQRLDGIRDFIAGLESYYNDHFGFRKRLIRTNNHYKHQLFRESTRSDVLTGRAGWLYYSGDRILENHLGLEQFQPQDLHEWQSLLEARRDWLAKRGIRYILVIPPDKDSIYPEFWPPWLAAGHAKTKLDQFMAYMKTNSTVEILDLRPVLLEAKKSGRVYLMTDTHWNFAGAFLAIQELVRALSRQLPGLEPLPLGSFKWTLVTWDHGGDLARMLGQNQTMVEREVPVFTPVPPLQPLVAMTAPELLAGKKWDKFKEPVFTVNSNLTGKAIVFRDSYSRAWIPFLGYYFGKVIYIWEYNWEPAFIEQQKPVVVIDEILERSFYTTSPRELKISDNLK